MSFAVQKLVYATRFDCGVTKAVLASIAEQAHEDGRCYEGSTTIEHLIQRTNFGRNAVCDALKRLRAFKILVPVEMINGKASDYRVELGLLGDGFSYQKADANQLARQTGLPSKPVGETNLDQLVSQTPTSLPDKPVPVGDANGSIYKETNPTNHPNQSSLSAQGLEIVRRCIEVLREVPGCANARGGTEEDHVKRFVETAERNELPIDADLIGWSQVVRDRALDKAYYKSEMCSKSPATMLQEFMPDIQIARAKKVTTSPKLVGKDPLEQSVARLFATHSDGGGHVKPGISLAAYADQLRKRNVSPEIVDQHGTKVLSGPHLPIAKDLAEALSKYEASGKREVKVLGSDDRNEEFRLLREELRRRELEEQGFDQDSEFEELPEEEVVA